MANARVTHHHLTTTADPDTVAKLLAKAWEQYHEQWWAKPFLRGTARLTDKGNHTYLLNNYNGAFTVKITGAENGSKVDTHVYRTRTTQRSVMLMPILPKRVQVESTTRNVIERNLYQALIDAGCEVQIEKETALL